MEKNWGNSMLKFSSFVNALIILLIKFNFYKFLHKYQIYILLEMNMKYLNLLYTSWSLQNISIRYQSCVKMVIKKENSVITVIKMCIKFKSQSNLLS